LIAELTLPAGQSLRVEPFAFRERPLRQTRRLRRRDHELRLLSTPAATPYDIGDAAGLRTQRTLPRLGHGDPPPRVVACHGAGPLTRGPPTRFADGLPITSATLLLLSPGIAYDILRKGDGQRGGGGLNLVWSRAAEPVQAPGNAADLGVELDVSIFYQGLGGTYDAEGNVSTGFYGQLDYAVLFPLEGLGYLPAEQERRGSETDLSIAHMLRLYMGILF
jgi:hypothetical protein